MCALLLFHTLKIHCHIENCTNKEPVDFRHAQGPYKSTFLTSITYNLPPPPPTFPDVGPHLGQSSSSSSSATAMAITNVNDVSRDIENVS